MKIYTKTGDEGFTMLPGGRRLRKSEPVIEMLGNIDELDAHIGVCIEMARASSGLVAEVLAPVQPELLVLGSMLAACAGGVGPKVRLDEDKVARLERQIDDASSRLPELKHFIHPGGSPLSCQLHVARTVARRAERRVVSLLDSGLAAPAVAVVYLNRLSDLLFVLARLANYESRGEEVVWDPQREKPPAP
jgi:cob(I)alamin adenosyltransferase